MLALYLYVLFVCDILLCVVMDLWYVCHICCDIYHFFTYIHEVNWHFLFCLTILIMFVCYIIARNWVPQRPCIAECIYVT